MDLLNQNYNAKPERTKGSKIVITLLIVCILLLIIVIGLMIYLNLTKTPVQKLEVNGTEITLEKDVIVQDSEGEKYISLKDLAGMLGYKYNNGEYRKYEEDKTKCYIVNNYDIVGFSANSAVIYKTVQSSEIDYEYYHLSKNILVYQDKLYIALVDLNKALNVVYDASNPEKVVIKTPTYIAQTNAENLKNSNYVLTSDSNNLKAVAYGMLVVSRDGLWGVIDSNYKEIIGNKYRTMQFDEYSMNYIVSNERNQYGIITTDGSVDVALKYDSLKVISHEPLLYEVSKGKKYGIMEKDGKMLTEIEYDRIGFPADAQNKINYTLIIPDLDGKTGKTIVVNKEGKYGLIYLSNGKTFLPCDTLDRLYQIEELGELKYKVEFNKKTYSLEDFIEYARKQTMVVN